MRFGLAPFLLAAVERDQVDVRLRQLGIDLHRGFVLRRGAGDVALPLERQAPHHVGAAVASERTHVGQQGVFDGRPARAVGLPARQRLARVVEPVQVSERQSTRIPGGAELRVEPDGRVELGDCGLELAVPRAHPAQPVARVRFRRRLLGKHGVQPLALVERSGLEERVRQIQPRRDGRRLELDGLRKQNGGVRVVRLVSFGDAAQVVPVEAALEGPGAGVHGCRAGPLFPCLEQHRQRPDSRWVVRMVPSLGQCFREGIACGRRIALDGDRR